MSAPDSTPRGAADRPSLSPTPWRPVGPATLAAESDESLEYFAGGRPPSLRSRGTRLPPAPAPSPAAAARRQSPGLRRQPSVRIRRNSAASSRSRDVFQPDLPDASVASSHGARPRSISQPERATPLDADIASMERLSRRTPQMVMPRLTEEGSRPTLEELGVPDRRAGAAAPDTQGEAEAAGSGGAEAPHTRLRKVQKVGKMLWPGADRRPAGEAEEARQLRRERLEDEYGEDLVDWLDIIDPEVQTLSTLTNVQNTLFVPNLGNWLNRRPTYTLSSRDYPPDQWHRPLSGTGQQRIDKMSTTAEEPETQREEPQSPSAPRLQRSNTITSRLTDSHYAALPHGTTLDGWTAEEKWELDDHVRHMLHSRRAKFHRTMKGVGQYMRRPLGFLVTLYATLITLFGLAWVLFLIGWIYVGAKQSYVIFIIDSVLVALFACMGIGLAPFRLVDTYRMIFIVRYTRILERAKTERLNSASGLRKNEPSPDMVEEMAIVSHARSHTPVLTSAGLGARPSNSADADGGLVGTIGQHGASTQGEPDPGVGPGRDFVSLEDGESEDLFEDPLTPKQRKRLEHHQKKLARSHSFYKPHDTYTHFAFPLKLLIVIVILVDCHSCLQIALSSCTWGISYKTRPFALTTVILCVSITCNISAGIVILVGDRKTRKKDVHKLLDRQELTGDAIKRLQHKRRKENKKAADDEDGASSSNELRLLPSQPTQ